MSDDAQSENGYDPFEYVPDRIDAISADGLVEMHEAMNEQNTANLESLPIEEQALMLWRMVENGVITVGPSKEGRR